MHYKISKNVVSSVLFINAIIIFIIFFIGMNVKTAYIIIKIANNTFIRVFSETEELCNIIKVNNFSEEKEIERGRTTK